MSAELVALVTSLAQRARAASLVLATTPTPTKNAALAQLAALIDVSHEALLAANQQDLLSPEASLLSPASRDRLTLDPARLTHLAQSVREVVALPDPVGTILDDTTRPNVTVDCAILCLKSGNASILRGGKECFHTNTALAALIQQALASAGLPADAVQLVPTTDRAALTALLKLDTLIHCLIPRGGEGLIRFVAQNSTIPVIKHYKGVCFVYADAAADLAMAESITLNAKVTRPSACNSAEQLLVHRSIAEKFLPTVARALIAKNVQLRCDPASLAILTSVDSAPFSHSTSPVFDSAPPNSARSTLRAQLSTSVAPATEADFSTEFLDYVIAIRVVDSVDQAIALINRDSSAHSDAIVTADESTARRFLAEVDSATVFWNASTRFNDGFEFGFGAEIGISTDRLHARGPMGLPELCSYKYQIEGSGQIRG
jgi:glutamate-5-semialdehyde dehydrogenase